MDCSSGLYALGGNTDNERLGAGRVKLQWMNYEGPVALGKTEFAYARCGEETQAVMHLTHVQSAKDRAKNVTSSLAAHLNVPSPRPLTVFVLLFDSVSRFQFYRSFPKTFEFLNKELVAGRYKQSLVGYDFKINNNLGKQTLFNMSPIYWGHSLYKVQQMAKGWRFNSPEHVPFWDKMQETAIWRIFEAHGFATLFTYDTLGNFIVQTTGYKLKTDHRAFNFWKVAQELFKHDDNNTNRRCIGIKDSSDYQLEYAFDFVKNYEGVNRFAYVHLSTGHEKTGAVIRTADEGTKQLLEGLFEYSLSHQDEDIAIMLMSDHGFPLKSWRESRIGSKETRLPGHFLFASQRLINNLEAHEILTKNSQILTSRYDWHWTFRHLATAPYGRVRANSPVTTYWSRLLQTSEPHSVLLETHSKNRTCDMLEIPTSCCVCSPFEEIPFDDALKDEELALLVEQVLQYIDAQIHTEMEKQVCSAVSLDSIEWASYRKSQEESVTEFEAKVNAKEDEFLGFEFSGSVTNSSDVKITSVRRVHINEASFCEQLKELLGINNPFCVCRDPATYSDAELQQFPALTGAYETLVSKLNLMVALEDASCADTCIKYNKSCLIWGLQLIRSPSILTQIWRTDETYKIYQNDSDISPMLLVKEKSIKQDTLLGISNKAITFGEFAKPSCIDQKDGIQGICPCSLTNLE